MVDECDGAIDRIGVGAKMGSVPRIRPVVQGGLAEARPLSTVFETDALAAAVTALIAIGEEERALATWQTVPDDAAQNPLHRTAPVETPGREARTRRS